MNSQQLIANSIENFHCCAPMLSLKRFDAFCVAFCRFPGILLTTDQKFDAFVSFEGLIKNDDSSIEAFKKSADQHIIYCTLSSVNNIMLRYNESDDRIAIFIDNNNDDVYDKELEKGDANCDGIIDARDAHSY